MLNSIIAQRVAIIGSRDYKDIDRIRVLVESLSTGQILPMLISGGARGPDSIAEKEAMKHGWDSLIFEVDWDNLGRGAGFARNTTIAKEADVVYAFWDGKSRGTLDTISKAVKLGKDVKIYADLV